MSEKPSLPKFADQSSFASEGLEVRLNRCADKETY